MMRTMVLLGAGASRDAGLPLTEEFARLLMREMASDFAEQPELAALNFVYGAMANHRAESGDDPLAAVNVETKISAIRLLAQRDTHEAAPFITSWKPSVNAFGHSSASGPVRAQDLLSGLARANADRFPSGDALLAAIRAIAEETSGRVPNEGLYENIERALLVRVRRLLSSPKTVDYLLPLVELARTQPDGLDVATLNYDRTVELAAEAAQVPVNVGIDGWKPGRDITFRQRNGVLNLLKVHGSIDWKRVPFKGRGVGDGLPNVRVVRTNDFRGDEVPAIVIGDREKLASGGPILALLHAFEKALRRADRLVVVGYSFADAHVNSVIRDWLAVDKRTLIVLDPGWPTMPSGLIRTGPDEEAWPGDLRLQLAWYLGMTDPGGGGRTPRLHVIRKGTAEGLAEALEAHPALDPIPRFQVTSIQSSDDPNVILASATNLGQDLKQVRVSANRPGRIDNAAAIEVSVHHPLATAARWSKHEQHLPLFAHGETVEVELRFELDRKYRHPILSISGHGELNHFSETWESEIGRPDEPLTRSDPRLRS
jgi:hypothetical protein